MPYGLITLSVRLKDSEDPFEMRLIPVEGKRSQNMRPVGSWSFKDLAKESQEKIKRLENDLTIAIIFQDKSKKYTDEEDLTG